MSKHSWSLCWDLLPKALLAKARPAERPRASPGRAAWGVDVSSWATVEAGH